MLKYHICGIFIQRITFSSTLRFSSFIQVSDSPKNLKNKVLKQFGDSFCDFGMSRFHLCAMQEINLFHHFSSCIGGEREHCPQIYKLYIINTHSVKPKQLVNSIVRVVERT